MTGLIDCNKMPSERISQYANALDYSYVRCAQCGTDWQNLDFGCALHRLTCRDPIREPARYCSLQILTPVLA